MRTRATIFTIITLISILILGYLVYRNNQKRINSVVLVQHSIEVGYQIAKIGAIQVQLKTLLLTYQNSKDTSLLGPIAAIQVKMMGEIKHLIYLTKDNRLQYQRAQLLMHYSNMLLQPVSKLKSLKLFPAQKNISVELVNMLDLIQKEEVRLLANRKGLYSKNLNAFNWFNFIILFCLLLVTILLVMATRKISYQIEQRNKRARELDLANQALSFESEQKQERASELIVANKELSFQNDEKERRAEELSIANVELSFQNNEKEKRAQELSIANVELSFQNNEKEKRAVELKATMLQLNKSESSLKEAQAISHTGNFEVDLITQTEVWSEGMYSILALDKEKTLPSLSDFLKYVHPDDLREIKKEFINSFHARELTKFEFRFFKSDDSLRYGYIEIQFELDIAESPIRIFGIFQDVTINKVAELERNKMVKELIQRNKDLEQFAYIISHNLRAPVANILGASKILKDENNTVDDETILKNGINESVLKLDGVIKDLNHILDVKTSINQQKEIVKFSDLVADIQNSITRLIDQNDISIVCDFNLADEILTLKPYLYSIFYNLITNSIKYRKLDTSVEIKISSRLVQKQVELTFTDNGIGINLLKNGEQLFGLYKRFHEQVEGKGMGLFMVKTQVEALDGNILAQSSEGNGIIFKITL